MTTTTQWLFKMIDSQRNRSIGPASRLHKLSLVWPIVVSQDGPWSLVTGTWLVVSCKYTSYIVFVEIQTKQQVDLLGNAGTTVSWIAWYGIPPFHVDNSSESLPRVIGYDFSGWSFWAWLKPAAG